MRRGRIPDSILLCLLLLLVAIVWCTHYGRWSPQSWRVPPVVLTAGEQARWRMAPPGDAFFGMAAARALAGGEIGVYEKTTNAFGAPFGVDWGDVPLTPKGISLVWAGLITVGGIFVASNLLLLLAHLLAAAGFFLVCRALRYERWLSLGAAALFALSPF